MDSIDIWEYVCIDSILSMSYWNDIMIYILDYTLIEKIMGINRSPHLLEAKSSRWFTKANNARKL